MRISDWGSDVCSSDLGPCRRAPAGVDQPVAPFDEAEIAGVAILPRKRVRTSWNGTGHSCFASNAWAVLMLGPLVAFFISFRPQQRSCSSCPNRQLRAEIGRAHVCTPVTNAHLVCRLLLEKQKNN